MWRAGESSLLRSCALLGVASASPAGVLLMLLIQGHRLLLSSMTGWKPPLLVAIWTGGADG